MSLLIGLKKSSGIDNYSLLKGSHVTHLTKQKSAQPWVLSKVPENFTEIVRSSRIPRVEPFTHLW